MTSKARASAGKHSPPRLWWAVPTLAVAATAITMGVVVGPGLAEHVAVPHRILVVAPTQAPSQNQATSSPSAGRPRVLHPRASTTPAVRPTPTPAPATTGRTQVVTPRRPVITTSGDDKAERESPSPGREGGDG